ncbi:MAG: phage portal protein, partial [Bacillota bacterium]
ATDLKAVVQHVIAYPISPDDNGRMTELYAEIHTPGRIETRIYAYDADRQEIGPLRSGPATASTGLDDFAVQVLSNITHSGSLYGVDDYSVINSIVQKLMWRLYCVDTVLDKHSEPSMSGPASALKFDERTGLYYLDLGNYFTRNSKEDPDLQYITWDGSLEAAYQEIDLLLKQLYTLSEMGQAFMEGGGGGEAPSGTALKLRMVSPRIKAARLVGINESTVKRIISMLARVNGIPLNYDGLTLHWNDGLPDDEVEQVNTLSVATGGKAIMSQYAAMKRMGLSDDEVEAELEQLREEQAAAIPVQLGIIDQHTEPPTEGDS